MDRFSRPFFACGLGLILVAGGCRSTQPEVPPGRPFAKDGQQRQAIQFSSEGHPAMAQGSAPYMPSNLGGSDLASGIATGGSRPDGAAYGGPPAAYGPPGSAGAANSPTNLSDPSAVRASNGPPASLPLTGTPPVGTPPINLPPLGSSSLPDLNVAPPRESLPAPSEVLPNPTEAPPGVMGKPDAMPSPN